ncbi:DUF6894 family protein [Salmonella enterica]|jgi:hypothetical protein|uniref:DUF6894 family protein n=1 Tax=Salmonella enterica TaxID=28901 RepID=UPI001879ECCC|nr:hypothetical protein [Salmonella enterica]MBE7608159.1 hypothetical protein [Salmonella enterica subsp. enterica serovar 4:-:1,2]
MPRYFFQVHDDREMVDDRGEECPDDDAACREAASYAGALLKEFDGRFRSGQEWRLDVTRGSGAPLFQIRIIAKRSI